MTTEMTFSMDFRLYDEGAFRKAAQQRALDDGMSEEEAAEFLDPDTANLEACAIMLLDPGSLVGCSVHSSYAQEN